MWEGLWGLGDLEKLQAVFKGFPWLLTWAWCALNSGVQLGFLKVQLEVICI